MPLTNLTVLSGGRVPVGVAVNVAPASEPMPLLNLQPSWDAPTTALPNTTAIDSASHSIS
jgi:hypothetical protein